MTAHERISVVLCTFNGELYLDEQLASIASQTLRPFEIIISDDGSADATLDVAHRFAAASSIPVRVRQNPTRLGFADNFLTACEDARGSHIALSDQDDRWHAGKLAAQLAAVRAHQAGLCTHVVARMDSDGVVRPSQSGRRSSTEVLDPRRSSPWKNFYGFTMVFDRALLDLIPSADRGLDPYSRGKTLSHDRWIYFLATTFSTVVVLHDDLAFYRQHEDQLFGGTQSRSVSERIATKVAEGEDQARYLAVIARYRAQLLEDHSRRAGAPLDETIARWRRVSSHYEQRALIYRERSRARRVFRTVGNVRAGIYRTTFRQGLGPRTALEDLAVALYLKRPA